MTNKLTYSSMSGHSKWSQIKRQKGITDKKRGQLFSKLSRVITLAVREGGNIPDPDRNVKLRLAVEKAKTSNMPKDTIERAISRAKGVGANELKEVVYEGFAPGGISLMILSTTDNPNRTHAEVRTLLEKHGGKMGSYGSAAFNFDKCGIIVFKKEGISEDQILELGEALSVKDIETDPTHFVLYIPFEQLGHSIGLLPQSFPKPEMIDTYFRPLSTVPISQNQEESLINLINILEELEDVHRVYANYETTH